MTDQFKKIHPGAMSGMTGPLGGRGSKASPPRKRTRPQKERRKKPRPTKTAKPESKMESRKKDKPVKPSEYIRRVISGPGDRRASNQTQLESMGSVKGGTRKDLQEFSRDIKQTEKIQKRNVVALRKLKHLKTEVKRHKLILGGKGLEKSTRKGVERLLKKDITDPTRRATEKMVDLIRQDVPPWLRLSRQRRNLPKATGNIATRAAKKADKERFQKLQKRVDREKKERLKKEYKKLGEKVKKLKEKEKDKK